MTGARALKKQRNPQKTQSSSQISKPQTPKKTKQNQKQQPHNPTKKTPTKQQKQTNKISHRLSGWLFQIAIAVCPALHGHVKDKAQNWKSEMEELCIGKLGRDTIWLEKCYCYFGHPLCEDVG